MFGGVQAVLRHGLHVTPTPMPPYVAGEETEAMKGNTTKRVALGLHLLDEAFSSPSLLSLRSLLSASTEP